MLYGCHNLFGVFVSPLQVRLSSVVFCYGTWVFLFLFLCFFFFLLSLIREIYLCFYHYYFYYNYCFYYYSSSNEIYYCLHHHAISAPHFSLNVVHIWQRFSLPLSSSDLGRTIKIIHFENTLLEFLISSGIRILLFYLGFSPLQNLEVKKLQKLKSPLFPNYAGRKLVDNQNKKQI